nr:transposase [Piscirickettsia salmonis]
MLSTPWLAAEGLDDGVLALDDMIAEKPYSDENDIIAWHYDHSKGRTVKGINILTAMVRYGDVSLPIAYEVIEKTIRYSDLQTKKERRKSSFTKNDLFLKLLNVAIRNDLKFAYVLADRWFSSQSNMSYIHNVGKKFIMGIKSNRCVALTEKDKENGKYQQLKQISRKRRYLGRYFAHPMMQNRRAKRDDYKPSAVRVTQRCVP